MSESQWNEPAAPAEPLPEVPVAAIVEQTAIAESEPTNDKTRHFGPKMVRFTLRDLLLLTYALPAERLRPHVPENLPLDMLPGPDGERLAFVQTLCAFHENARWALLPETVGQSFHQITYRILTRRAGRRGAFTLRTDISTDEGRAAQRALSRDANFARFTIYIAGDPARGTYRSYTLRAIGDQGQTQIDAHSTTDATLQAGLPKPFTGNDELATFLTDRPDNYYRSSAPKSSIGLLQLQYSPLPTPVFAELAAPPRLSLWSSLLNMTPEELQNPYSLLLIPSVGVASYAPQYARLKPTAAA